MKLYSYMYKKPLKNRSPVGRHTHHVLGSLSAYTYARAGRCAGVVRDGLTFMETGSSVKKELGVFLNHRETSI